MPRVIPKTFAEIESAIRGAWSADTRDPSDDWSPANPASGQCGVTALVLNDIFGGHLLVAEVQYVDGTHHGNHYWNRFGGIEVDLTREQFDDSVVIRTPSMVTRPPGPPRRCAEQYSLLRHRVFAALGLALPEPPVKSGEIRSSG